MSKKIVLNAAGDAATVTEATISDILTTALSTDSVVTGTYGLVQKAGLVVFGMAFQEQRRSGSWNPL